MRLKLYQQWGFLFLAVFLFSFLWIFALTHNFPLFWEDSSIVQGYTSYQNNYERYSSNAALFSEISNAFLDTRKFNRTEYMDRPLGELFMSPYVVRILGFNSLVLRSFKALTVAVLCTLYFVFLCSLCTRNAGNRPFFLKVPLMGEIIIPILSWAYLLALPEVFMMALYFIDTLPYTLIFSTAPIMLFYFFYVNDSIKNKFLLSVLFLSIVFFTEVSILIQHVGRINFLLFFLFILFTDWKKLLRFRHWFLILTLFMLSIPLLGLLRVIVKGSFLTLTQATTYHTTVAGSSLSEIVLQFITTFHLSFLPHAFFLVLPFMLFVLLHLYALFVKKKGNPEGLNVDALDLHASPHCSLLRRLAIFSFLWFMFNAGMLFVARSFVLDPKYFLRFEFTLFLFSQALFLISYCMYVHKRYFSAHKILQYLLIFCILLSILQNTIRLNEWRGGWGAYFLGYDTARQYVDDHARGALLLLPMDHASPVYFSPLSTNTHAMVADLTNAYVVRQYRANYSALYIANRGPMVFDDPNIVSVANLTIVDKSLYGIFKKAIGKYYPTPFYLYTLND